MEEIKARQFDCGTLALPTTYPLPTRYTRYRIVSLKLSGKEHIIGHRAFININHKFRSNLIFPTCCNTDCYCRGMFGCMYSIYIL